MVKQPRSMNPVDLHVGKRLRRRRRLLGLTQEQLADSIGIKFQQIQKYECGANKVTASRLFALACALQVPVNYFFVGLVSTEIPGAVPLLTSELDPRVDNMLQRKDTLDLIRAYYQLAEGPRKKLLALAQSMQPETGDTLPEE